MFLLSLPAILPFPAWAGLADSTLAQTPQIGRPQILPQVLPRPFQPEPTQPLTPRPPADELLPQPAISQPAISQPAISQPAIAAPGQTSDTISVQRFEVLGSTVFSAQDFAEITKRFLDRNLTFAELLQVRSAIVDLYVRRGYVTSAAVLPPQRLTDGTVKIQVIEGSLESINVAGTRRLNPNYIRSRLNLAASKPLNVERLLEGLQLLQLDPLVKTISADLQTGTQPGTSVLQVMVTEANTLSITPSIDNSRSPSVGSLRRQIEVAQANLLGIGDGLRVSYTNTDGSNGIDTSYTVPINPHNGTVRLAYSNTHSTVIEKPFDVLDIQAKSRYYEFTYRQPIVQHPASELAVGLTFSRQESQTELGIDHIGPFPLSPGADDQGRTRISALRFFQEWVNRTDRQVIAARSQFSTGLGLFDATSNANAPDSHFFTWRGQAQWTRLLARDTLFLIRGEVQLADRSLVPLEQFGIGGQETVRGYRQDALLTDSGLLFSTEFRLPILRTARTAHGTGVLQLTPFIDIGSGWNRGGNNPDSKTLVGAGLGLLWRQGDNFSARLDFGFPLISIEGNKSTLQENGIYFSIKYSPSF